MLNPIIFSYNYDLKTWMRRYQDLSWRINELSNIHTWSSYLEHEFTDTNSSWCHVKRQAISSFPVEHRIRFDFVITVCNKTNMRMGNLTRFVDYS